jgi:outer membrane protein OmpA-like peptidoglycan-associated protein
LGAELVGSTPFTDTIFLSSTPRTEATATTNAEVLFGAKLRFLEGLTVGAMGGPGLGSGIGTPTFRVGGMIGWTPLAWGATKRESDNAALVVDTDDDGIPDQKDACPEIAGEPNLDPAKDGCPPADRDGDGVRDVDDACPTTSGLPNSDLTQNGCPTDTDGDGFHDGIDACREVIGDPSDDEKKRGCPADDDGDGIANKADACPQSAGDPHDDPDKTGCPPDPDQDGIRYAADACPNEKGPPSDDPRLNGCPRFARYQPQNGEIEILQKIEFQTYGAALSESVTPNSIKVLKEVAQIIADHPEITLMEVQGHTDDSGDQAYNLELSQKRADSIREWLIEKGNVAATRLVAKGYGMNRPIADNRTRQGRQENRRVQFITKTIDESLKTKTTGEPTP